MMAKTFQQDMIRFHLADGHMREFVWAVLQIVATAASGRLVGIGYPALAITLPLLAMSQPNRTRASVVALAYYLAAGADILQVGSYLKVVQIGASPALFWIAAAFLQSVAWSVCWSSHSRLLRTTAALLISALPPLGIIGWAHPFHAAGAFFPGLGVSGLLLMFVLLELAAFEPTARIALPFLALGASLLPTGTRPAPPQWAGMRTRHGDVFTNGDPLNTMESMNRELRLNQASILVWPESIVGRWNQATELFWSELIRDARARGKTLILGAAVTAPDSSLTGYRNVILFKGKEEPLPVDQRIPIPVAMWQPAGDGGVPLKLFLSPIREIGGQRAGFLVCYEQLLAWSYLALILEQPTLLVGVANVCWVEGSAIPAAQTACLRSWARLFDIPFIQAVNQ